MNVPPVAVTRAEFDLPSPHGLFPEQDAAECVARSKHAFLGQLSKDARWALVKNGKDTAT